MTQQPGSKRSPASDDPQRRPAPGKPEEKLPGKIGRYTIVKKLGQGGMGAVFLATDSVLKRQVALKVLPRDKAENPTLVRRFQSEAQAAAHLKHENIVAVYDAGEADGYLYIALEFIDGTDVANLVLKRGVLPVKRSLEIIRQTAAALQHASEHKIVHRDIKPGNLLIRRDGVVKLADMGLARIVDETADTSITRTGTTVGTVDYISPEQARNSKSADVRSDIYSLGCAWYYMLTGSPPFSKGDITNKLQAHFSTPFPDPRDLNPQVTEPVCAVMRRMTEKNPDQRYQSAEELLSDLTAVQQGSNRVSEAILSDDREEGSEGAVSSDEERSAGRRRRKVSATEMPVAGLKGSSRERDAGGSELPRALMFYAVCGLAVVGLIGGVIWLIQQMNTAIDTGDEHLGQQLAEAEKRGGQQKAIGGNGNTSVTADKATTAETQNRRIGEEERGDTPVLENRPKTVSPGDPTVRLGGGADGGLPAGSSQAGTVGAGQRAREESSRLPAWAREQRLPPKRTLVVSPRSGNRKEFANLNLALREVPPEGARIVLSGSGPFPVRVDQIRDCGRVVLEAADDGETPLIVLLEPERATVNAFLTFQNTSLELHNVHIATNVTGFATSPGDAFIHVEGGELLARNCSFSARGTPVSGMSALRVSGLPPATGGGASTADGPARTPRLLLSQCVVRGDNLTAVTADGGVEDLVLHNSLVLAGAAPSLRITEPPSAPRKGAGRVLLSATTLLSSNTALECALPDPASAAARVEITALNSLLTAPAGSTASCLLTLTSPGADPSSTTPGKQLTWKTTGSGYPGWKRLVRIDPGDKTLATSQTQWTLLFDDDGVADRSFPRKGWPALDSPSWSELPLTQFERDQLKGVLPEVAGGGLPGCVVADLKAAGLAGLDGQLVQGQRPQIPVGLSESGGVRETLRVDLARDDLGKVLGARKLATGLSIVATGAGVCQTSPIVIRDAWVRLQFVQGPGKPLVLLPKSNSPPNDGPDALISVLRGGLEIQGGVLLATGMGVRINAPQWLISATDSDLVLRQCRLQGPLGDPAGRTAGVIEWRRSAADAPAPARPFSASHNGYLVINDCFLLGSGTLLDADIGGRVVAVQNSVLFSRRDAIQVRLAESAAPDTGVVDLTQVTLSAPQTSLAIESPASRGPTPSSLKLFADRCVFGPVVKRPGDNTPATLMTVSGSALAGGQIQWWETSCGYAPDVECLLRSPDEAAAAQDFRTVWVDRWGAANCLSPLSGAQGILLRSELPTKASELADLETSQFQLLPNSRGAAWDGGVGAIGAQIDRLLVPSPKAATSGGPGGKAKGSKSRPATEGF